MPPQTRNTRRSPLRTQPPPSRLQRTSRFPPVIAPTFLWAFLPRTRRASPVASYVLVTVPSLAPRRSGLPYHPRFGAHAAFACRAIARPPGLFLSRPPHVHFRYGPPAHHPKGGFVSGLQAIGFPPTCHSSYGAVAIAPAGLSPAERTNHHWTSSTAGTRRRGGGRLPSKHARRSSATTSARRVTESGQT